MAARIYDITCDYLHWCRSRCVPTIIPQHLEACAGPLLELLLAGTILTASGSLLRFGLALYSFQPTHHVATPSSPPLDVKVYRLLFSDTSWGGLTEPALVLLTLNTMQNRETGGKLRAITRRWREIQLESKRRRGEMAHSRG